MSLQSARQLVLGFHPDLPVVVEESAAQLSSDGGLLVIREFDERLKFTERFAAAIQETRDPTFTRHGVLSLARQRMYGLLAAALPEPSKKRLFNRRRRHDPLGEGQPCTWRSRLIKVAVEVIVRSRRVLVKLSSSWPHAGELFRIGGRVALSGSS